MRRLVIAAALCMPLAALAQSTPDEYLKLFDSNGDGKVSEAEYVAYMSQGFYRMDTDHDGLLESSELPGGRGKPITLKEFQDNLRHQFHQLDRHHHGYLNAQELTAPPQG
jgi:Ca2+-binding EF-hand superfamily protein